MLAVSTVSRTASRMNVQCGPHKLGAVIFVLINL